jgi:hypothetical protein
MFFNTKPQAKRWLKAESKDTTCQQCGGSIFPTATEPT